MIKSMLPESNMMINLKPIHSEDDYRQAMQMLGLLWGAAEGSPESDQLDILATLIEKYEEENFPMDLPDPVDAILFRMEQQGLSRKDLEPMLGTRNRVSEVLNRRRGMSIEMIRALHEGLKIPAEVLIKPSKIPA
jgi:HTH-type transcriptional regulator/antitoxin HigA